MSRSVNSRKSAKSPSSSPSKVLLLSMPMGAMERPALGLSYLKSQLVRRDLACDVRYPSFTFADMIGAEEYRWVSSELPYIAFAGDWCFTECLYGPRPEADLGYISQVLRGIWQLNDTAVQRLLKIRQNAGRFLEYCLQSIPWQDYAIVGFTSTFEQNIASLALGKRIKELYPHLSIVFGGANWEGEMGLELHRQFSFIDYVCSGEADESFPNLVRHILAKESDSKGLPPGVIYRAAGQSLVSSPTVPIRDMNELPIPDYADYFEQWYQSSAALVSVPVVLVETSRGCWWGNKSHCTFCGLNGATMSFRSKSGPRALQEIKYLADTWQTDRLEVVDNILDMKYFNDLLPALAEDGRPWQIFFEVKANLTRKHVAALKAAGINRIQPGIESINDHVLSLMGKGTTGLRNVQLLKWCREYGIGVDWNMLYGFPGETAEDYQAMLAMIPSIEHLQPPVACGSIRMDRFSPYFERASTYGLTNVRPMKPYEYLYPFEFESLMKIAYHFEFDYSDGCQPCSVATELVQAIEQWKARVSGQLTAIRQMDGSLLISDSRRGQARRFTLPPLEAAVYDYCDEVHSLAAIVNMVREQFPNENCQGDQLLDWLQWLASQELILNDGDNWLSLAVRVPTTVSSDHASAVITPRASKFREEVKLIA